MDFGNILAGSGSDEVMRIAVTDIQENSTTRIRIVYGGSIELGRVGGEG
jgi:hypothetical protein